MNSIIRAHRIFMVMMTLLTSISLLGQNPSRNTLSNIHSSKAKVGQFLLTQNHMDTPQINLQNFQKSHWSSLEVENATLVTDFVQHVMNDHDLAYIKDTFGDHPYIQHNRNMLTGIAGIIEYMSAFTKRYPEFSYDVKHIRVDGSYVIFHSHATLKKKHRGNEKQGLNITDTWKVEDGKIVEHWDSVQPISGFMRFFGWMTGGKIRNSNGVF